MSSIRSNRSGPSPWVIVAGGFHREGGMDRANLALAEYLCAHGIPLHLVGYRVEPEISANPLVTVTRVRRPTGSFFLGGRELDRMGRAVAHAVTLREPDARVLVNGANCSWPDINWVHYVHHAWQPPMRLVPLRHRMKIALAAQVAHSREAARLPRARIVLANSERTRRDLVAHLGLAPERVHTVYLGSDHQFKVAVPEQRARARELFGMSEARPVVTFVGAFGNDSRKGFDTLWSAWQRLCVRSEWDADLFAAGGGPALSRWTKIVAKSRLAERVRFLGPLGNVGELLTASDLLVSPVRYESYGLNVQEALRCGIPAIVTASAGVAERYPAPLGDLLLPDPEDADDLAARMLRWRSDLEGYRRSVKPLAQTLNSYSWDDMAESIVSLVEKRAVAPQTRTHLRAALHA